MRGGVSHLVRPYTHIKVERIYLHRYDVNRFGGVLIQRSSDFITIKTFYNANSGVE